MRHDIVHECCKNKWRAWEQIIKRDYSRLALIESMESRKKIFVCAHIRFFGIRAASVFTVKAFKVEDAGYGKSI
jgi:hypothetical protein